MGVGSVIYGQQFASGPGEADNQMERIIVKALLYFGSMNVVNGKVYTPCELVRAIENEKNTDSDRLDFDYEKHIPLVVCIAGYRKYDTSYKLTHPNGTGYHGIFGIHNSDVKRCYKPGDLRGPQPPIDQLRNEVLGGDLRCLAHIVLASKVTVDYYEKLCSPPFVRKVSCPLNNYAVTTVFDPIRKDIFERTFGTNEDPLSLLTSAFSSATEQPTAKPSTEPPKTSTIYETQTIHTASGAMMKPSEVFLHSNTPESPTSLHQHNSHSNDLHWTQKFTVFTCVIVIFALLVLAALKVMACVEKYKANRNSSLRQKYHFDAESEMMHS